MSICVKNPRLKKKIFKSIRYWENLALKAYEKGDMVKGRRYEKKGDKLYKDNYNKMFEVCKNR